MYLFSLFCFLLDILGCPSCISSRSSTRRFSSFSAFVRGIMISAFEFAGDAFPADGMFPNSSGRVALNFLGVWCCLRSLVGLYLDGIDSKIQYVCRSITFDGVFQADARQATMIILSRITTIVWPTVTNNKA